MLAHRNISSGGRATTARPASLKRFHGRVSVAPRAAAATGAPAAAAAATDALATLRRAASKPGSVKPSDVLAAMTTVEKAKLKPENWEANLTAPGTRWRLIYTVSGKDITAAAKKQKAGSGGYFPINACQKFDDTGFENGVFFGPVASLTFKGPWQLDAKVCHFDVNTMSIGLGPWRFPIKLKDQTPLKQMATKEFKALPFFVYAYVGEDIVVARGRSGGVALWGRADADWLATSGALAVYK